jgi:hypothetical protein
MPSMKFVLEFNANRITDNVHFMQIYDCNVGSTAFEANSAMMENFITFMVITIRYVDDSGK